MVDIIILNLIGSYKVKFNGTIFVLRPIFYLKTPLMTKKGSVGNTCDADAVSHKISLMGNYKNQVSVVGWGFLLSQHLTNSLDQSRWVSYLYLLCTFKMLLYLSVDKDCNSQYNALLDIPTSNNATNAYNSYL